MSPQRACATELGLRLAAAAVLCLCFALVGCRSGDGIRRAKPMDPERVPAALAEAEAVMAQGDAAPLPDLARSVKAMRSARVTDGLAPEVKRDVQLALEATASDLIRRGDDPAPLKELIESELPMRLAARAGVRAAELLFAEGERMKAFKTIRALDRRYPSHTQKQEAGALVARIGQALAADRGRYLLFFKYRSLAPEVLEYLALEYPQHEDTDDGLAKLAEIYEGRRLWADAIVKHQELVLWAPESPFRVGSEASIPRLRLAALDRPDYARDALVAARDELLRWLTTHPNDPLRPDVERMLVDARQRLADNDLFTARFYRTVESPAGVRFHALRAEAEARLAGNLDQVREAEALLAEAIDVPTRVEVDELERDPATDPRSEVFEGGGSRP